MTRAPLALLLLLLLRAAPAAAQGARVLVPGEALRSAPGSTVLAKLAQGTHLGVGAPRAGWREATLEGWIPATAVRGDAAGVVVTAGGGEDLRTAPGGQFAAYVPTGVFLERTGAEGGWVHVRRTGWVRDRAVRVEAAAPAVLAAPGGGPPRAAAAPRGTISTTPAAPPVAPARRPGARAGDAGAAILARPGADTLALLPPFAPVEVIGRQGAWTRVRVEGWVPDAALAAAGDSAGVMTDLTAAALMANPDTYRGRAITWSVQFIALRTAEPIRTDFRPGEPFLLTRGPGREVGFVYIAVPAGLLAAAKRLQPLQRIRVLARVREGRSPLMGAPVLELLELH